MANAFQSRQYASGDFIKGIKASMAEMYWALTKTIWIPVGIR